MIINNSSLVFVIETKKGRSKRSEYKETLVSVKEGLKGNLGFLNLNPCSNTPKTDKLK